MRPFCRLLLRGVRADSPPFAVNGKLLGERLMQRRLELGFTQTALADKLGICRKTLQNWENGRTRPTGKVWREIRSLIAGYAV
jgi:DNA-binding XRE family transcriptional regulator